MLPRPNRIGSSRDFAAAYARGRQLRSAVVTLYVLPRGRSEPRFGISVSKKVGGAVQRNRVKRRLREACRAVLKDSAAPFDFVLVARQAALELEYQELLRTVARLVSQAAKDQAVKRVKHGRDSGLEGRGPGKGH